MGFLGAGSDLRRSKFVFQAREESPVKTLAREAELDRVFLSNKIENVRLPTVVHLRNITILY
jgi:hypothetical protein